MEKSEMLIELWGTNHLIIIGVLLAVLALFWFILKDKDDGVKNKVLLIASFVNLGIHVLKLFLPEFKDDMPASIKGVTFETIYSVLVYMLPFVLLTKNSIMKDFMFYIAFIVPLLTIIYPIQMVGTNLKDISVIIFFLTHIILFVVPFYMVFFGFHELNIKRVPLVPAVLILVLGVILANEVILMESGLVGLRGSNFMKYNYRNTSFIFGPMPELKELSDKIIEPLVPDIFKTVPTGAFEGQVKYLPIAWLLVPSFVYLSVVSALVCLFFVKVLKKGGDGGF